MFIQKSSLDKLEKELGYNLSQLQNVLAKFIDCIDIIINKGAYEKD